MRQPRTWRSAVMALLVLASTGVSAAAEPPVLRAAAGFDGLVKAGRWTPVRVSVRQAASSIEGELLVTWGDARVRRHVTLPADSSTSLELYIRTLEVEDTIRVSYIAGGQELARTTATVRVQPAVDPITLCVATDRQAPPDASACTVSLNPELLPRSSRAYETIDDVQLFADAQTLSVEQREALQMWAAVRDVDRSGDLSLTGQVTRPVLLRGLSVRTLRLLGVLALLYAATLLIIGRTRAWSAKRLSHACAAVISVTAAGCGAVLALGQFGSSREVVVHHNSLVQQIPGTSGALVTTKGIAEFPVFGHFAIRWSAADAMLEPVGEHSEQLADDDGFPLMEGIFGLGGRQAFAAEATASIQPLAVETRGRMVRITNRTNETLKDCRFADGFASTAERDLTPGQTFGSEQSGDVAGPMFTCTMTGVGIDFVESERPVRMIGSTTVAVYRPAVTAEGARASNADD